MLSLKSATRLVARLRLPCVIRARRRIMCHRRLRRAAGTKPSHPIYQLQLFMEAGGRTRISRKRFKRVKGKPKGLQYRLKITLRETPRKIAYRLHAAKDRGSNDFQWGTEGVLALHAILLRESLEALKAMCEKQSSRAAEIMAWIERDAPDEPFSFVQCCQKFHLDMDGEAIGGQDPEILRTMTRSWVKKAWGTELPHAAVLRQGIIDAEGGDDSAFEWVMSDSDNPLSFNSCCEALGFDPEASRKELHFPNQAVDEDRELSRFLDKLFDQVFGHTDQVALAA